MGFLTKLLSRFRRAPAAAPAKAPGGGAARASSRPAPAAQNCPTCHRRMLPGAACPFCSPQQFGDVLSEGTVSADYQPSKDLGSLAGVVVAHAAAREHKARAFLHVFQGANKGVTVLIADRNVTLGRGTDNTLALNDGGASTRHCEIRVGPKGLSVHDLGSKNGLFINDTRMAERDLGDGDVIGIGQTRIFVGVVK